MATHRKRLRMFLFTLALGLAAVRFISWIEFVRSEIPVDLPPAASSDVLLVAPSRGPLTFEVLGNADACRYDRKVWLETYRSSQNVFVTYSVTTHNSEKEALRGFEREIKQATSVIEASGLNRDKVIAGRRVLLKVSVNSGDTYRILHYDGGNSFITISSPDPETTRAFGFVSGYYPRW